jgi:ABC-type sugar transport system permease subunit/ABC-type glycerol-3-phosphate transport system substrate-binding protein
VRLARATVLACVAASSAAAAGEEALVTPMRVGRPDAPLTLSVWAQQDYSHLAARPAISQAFTDVFAEWAASHPGVQLRVSVMPALEQHKAKLLLAAAAGRLPDIASVDSFWMPLFMAGGHVQPLNEHWPESDRADFLPFTIQTLSDATGNVYGVWHGTDCRVLYYRKDLVATPPRTWAELLDTASRVARERKIAGYLYNAGRWEAAVFDHLPMFWGQGGELVDAQGRPVFGEPPHRERMLNVLSFLRDTIRTGASPRSVLANNDYQQLTSAAVAGDVAMFLGGSWQLRDLQTGLSPAEFAKWDMAPIPQRDEGAESTGTGGWVWVVFARDPVRRKAAAEFLLSVESPANVGRIAEVAGQLPVRRSAYRDVPFFRDNPWYARFGQMLVHGRARPAVPVYPALSEQLQLAVGYAVSGEKTPEQALEDAWAAVREIDARQRAAPASGRPGFDPVTLVPAVLAVLLALSVVAPLRGRQSGLRAWLLPALVLVTTALVYPMLDLLRIAFTDTRTHGAAYSYTLASFRALFADPAFYGMVLVTLVFVASSVALQLGLGLAIAVLIDAARRRGAAGTLAARVAVVSAWVIPGVLVGVLWRILLVENRAGIVNYWLSQAGLGPLPLLSSGALAMVSVIAANTWRGCAFTMILQFAGLQRIPRELHEAADLEGLGAWPRFRMVVLPMIAPVLALNLALITIQTLNTFDLILPLTGGGPARRTEVISLYMYRSAFYGLEAGRAAAVAAVMLALNLALALVAVRRLSRPRRTA